ncbi:MAG: hypothetical protein ABEH35_07805 [Haloarculaceae archaeon]
MSHARFASLTERRDVRILVAVAAVELLLVSAYFLLTSATATRIRYVLYPFVWINAGLWAVLQVEVPRATAPQRLGAAVVAAVYFFVLAWLAGLVGIVTDVPAFVTGLEIGSGSPGWERIELVVPPLYVSVLPYRVIGYLALSYLVYVTVLDTAKNALAGAVGLVSCVSCSFPIVASLIAGLTGGTAGIAGAVYVYSVDLSTATFLLAVALLYWRPGVGWLGRRLDRYMIE